MNIALFGGTFDPVHRGHLAVARAAVRAFDLDRVYFVPAGLPPHKQRRPLTAFYHRLAMIALATARNPRFIPSPLEADSPGPHYSIQTVRRLKKTLHRSDKLYFLIGIDAFRLIETWRQPVDLLGECDFIVASRPGYSLADVEQALPKALRAPGSARVVLKKRRSRGTIALPSTTIHWLGGIHEPVSSTQIRAAGGSVSRLSRYVPRAVAEYVRKERLYVW